MADDEQRRTTPTKPSYLEGHRLYRDRIVSEDQLIHYRTSWSIWIQTLFVIIAGTLAVHLLSEKCTFQDEQFDARVIFGICLLGSAAALFSSASIVVALVEIHKLKKRYEKYFPNHRKEAPWLPEITASTPLHIFGHLVNAGGPVVVIIAWVCFGAAVYLRCH
jgi:hypothetical protein